MEFLRVTLALCARLSGTPLIRSKVVDTAANQAVVHSGFGILAPPSPGPHREDGFLPQRNPAGRRQASLRHTLNSAFQRCKIGEEIRDL